MAKAKTAVKETPKPAGMLESFMVKDKDHGLMFVVKGFKDEQTVNAFANAVSNMKGIARA